MPEGLSALRARTGCISRFAVVGIALPPPAAVAYAAPLDVWVEERDEIQAAIAAKAEELEAMLQKAEVSGDVSQHYVVSGGASSLVGLRARYADLAHRIPRDRREQELARRRSQGPDVRRRHSVHRDAARRDADRSGPKASSSPGTERWRPPAPSMPRSTSCPPRRRYRSPWSTRRKPNGRTARSRASTSPASSPATASRPTSTGWRAGARTSPTCSCATRGTGMPA